MTLRNLTVFVALLLCYIAWPNAAKAQNVTIPDANLRSRVARQLGISVSAPIPQNRMASMTQLIANGTDGQKISDLTGIGHATGLTELELSDNQLTNIDSLHSLTNLTILSLSGNQLTNIDSLHSLTNLTTLRLYNNSITNIDSLRNLTNLTELYLHRNQLTNIDSLRNLTNLTRLWLTSNSITNIDSLRSLTNLTDLRFGYNNISDISALSGLTNLEHLSFGRNSTSLTDGSPLSGLTNLRELHIFGNGISDISVLSGLTNLEWLHAQDNGISDISVLSGLTNLKKLHIPDNDVSDISALSSLTNLEVLAFYVNNISDISALSGLTNLKTMFFEQNDISDLSPLVTNTGIGAGDEIYLRGNPLSATARNVQIPALRNRGPTISFSPAVTLVLSSPTIDESGPNNQATVTVTLDQAMTTATTVTVSATAIATDQESDFTLSDNKVLIIPAGATSVPPPPLVTITAVDNAADAPENKRVTVSAVVTPPDRVWWNTGVTPPYDVILTIRDDEGDPDGPGALGGVADGDNDELNLPLRFTDTVDFQRYRKGSPITPLMFPAASGGRGTLTYGLAPPPGLTYTPPSEEDTHGGVLSGTPTEPKGKTRYALTVADENQDTTRASLSFYIVVEGDRMPSFGDTIAAQHHLQNREIEAITLPRATGGDGVLTYALTPDLPEGLSFDAETWVLSGTPLEAMAETAYALTATDEDGDAAALTFPLSVAADLMPSFGDATVAAQYWHIGNDYRVILPEATGGDGTLAYILLPYLPEGLSFDPETRVLSGIPLLVMPETEYTFSALDADGDAAALTFVLEIRLPSPDFNGDGRVNFADFILFVGKYGTRALEGGRYDPRYDLNADGAVGFADFQIFVISYGTEV